MNWIPVISVIVVMTSIQQTVGLKIAAFNIQRLSSHKLQDDFVVNTLVKILRQFDFVTVEEVMDLKAIDTLIIELNRNNPSPFAYVASEAIGRTRYKEHYAFMYRLNKVSVQKTHQYNDIHDDFEREPFAVYIHSPTTSIQNFGIVAVHIKPSDAEREISKMVEVYDEVEKVFNSQNVLMDGDFNADCRYFSNAKAARSPLHTDSRFVWLLDKTLDTTIRDSTDCSYDRFIVAGSSMKAASQSSRPHVYDFQSDMSISEEEALHVSDHYPIVMDIH